MCTHTCTHTHPAFHLYSQHFPQHFLYCNCFFSIFCTRWACWGQVLRLLVFSIQQLAPCLAHSSFWPSVKSWVDLPKRNLLPNPCPDRRNFSLIRHDLEVVQQMGGKKVVQLFNHRPCLLPKDFKGRFTTIWLFFRAATAGQRREG